MAKDTKTAPKDQNDALGDIVADLARLKDRAEHCGADDVYMIVDSAFKLCLSIYNFQSRGEYPVAE